MQKKCLGRKRRESKKEGGLGEKTAGQGNSFFLITSWKLEVYPREVQRKVIEGCALILILGCEKVTVNSPERRSFSGQLYL